MRSQRYLLWLPGLLQDGSVPGLAATYGTWPRYTSDTVGTELDFIAQGYTPVGAAATFVLTLDAGAGQVNQAGTYSLGEGLKIGENNVASPDGLTIPSGSFPGLLCTLASGASDIAAWLTLSIPEPTDNTLNWYAPTLGDFQARISEPELDKFTSSILQSGQPDTITTLLRQTVDYVYGYVAKGGFQLGVKGTLPRELVPMALDLAKEALFKRTASLNGFSETMRLMCQNLRQELKQVGDGMYAVSVPQSPVAKGMQTRGGVAIVTAARTSRMSIGQQDGLT